MHNKDKSESARCQLTNAAMLAWNMGGGQKVASLKITETNLQLVADNNL
jgi:hypothetical protein